MDGSTYEFQPSFILGFHGCDQAVGEDILSGAKTHLKPSEKEWDWLGHGIYFWEGNLTRAWDWALAKRAEGKIQKPFVLGCIINLGRCLDLFDLGAMRQVQSAYQLTHAAYQVLGKPLPKNVGKTPDRSGRALDCLVLNNLHEIRENTKQPAYDSVRGPFLEGDPIYDTAGFRSHSHIQICVRNTGCIKGYFRTIGSA